jgi:heptosyltransferase-3
LPDSETQPEIPSAFDRILLIQLGDIGDVILTLPTIKALRDNYPMSRIGVCVRDKAAEIIADCSWADDVIIVRKDRKPLKEKISDQLHWLRKLRAYRFDLAVDLRTGTRGAIIAGVSGAGTRIGRFAEDGRLWRNRIFTHLVVPPDERMQYAVEHNLNILSPLKLTVADNSLHLTVPSYRKQAVAQLFSRENIPLDRPLLAFHPFSLWKYKEWPVHSCVELIDTIQKKYDLTILITGSPDERERAERVVERCRITPFNLAGKTSIGELAAVLSACRGFIGVDTAALHLAAAVGIPTLGIFGPSPTVCWAPRGSQHAVVLKEMPCVPCREKGCGNTEISRCLDELTVAEMQEKLNRFLGENFKDCSFRP